MRTLVDEVGGLVWASFAELSFVLIDSVTRTFRLKTIPRDAAKVQSLKCQSRSLPD